MKCLTTAFAHLLIGVGVLGPHLAVAKPPVPEESLSLQALVNLPESQLATVDIATMNLAAAEGLPGSEQIDRAAIRGALDAWAHRVAVVTASKAHFFKSHPGYYDNTWAKFCSIMLVLTLQQDMDVHYNFEQRTNPSLAKSKDQFIHGIVEGTGGTCASLPVAFVAVGRRLGYPLKLVQGFSHYFARWDDPITGEQFNIEGSTPGGLDFVDDDFYREEALKKGAGPLDAGNYLKSMSPREELSSFLTTRADCLRERGRLLEAYGIYQQAVELAPENLFATELLRATAQSLRGEYSGNLFSAAFRQQDYRLRTDPRIKIPGMPDVPAAQAVSVRPHSGMNVMPPRSRHLPNGPAPRREPNFTLGYSHPPIPGMHSSPRARFEAMNSRNGLGLPSLGWSSPRTSGNPHTAPWNPSSMQDYLRETNRRTEVLRRFVRPGLHRSNHGAIPMAPTPWTPNHGTRP